jgi:uncharacterized protein with HEPN domain
MRDEKILLEDILASIKIIEDALIKVSESEFKEDKILQGGIIWRLSIIGEASKHVKKSLKNSHVEVDWRGIAGMRDFLIHEYFEIDMHIVWKTVKEDIPTLKKAVKDMLRKSD